MRSAHTSPRSRWVALPIIAVFLWLDHFHLDLFRAVAGDWTGAARTGALALLGYLPHWLVALGMAAVLTRPRDALAALGLDGRPMRALLLGLLLTAPMVAVLAFKAPLTLTADTPHALARHALLPGFGEELLYRGLLFGLLFRLAGWGFLPAALMAALLFGGAHLTQGGQAVEAAGIFAITALGAVWFAWLYVEWDFDLWVPVAFHVLINAWWVVFPVADNALGPLWAVGLRLVIIALSIGVTLAFAKRRGGRRVRGRGWIGVWRHD
ncbi:CPBP family glutamic-type intramembrane protease [Luteimonas terrae]|uniref:Membrane protease YdiL (CAAX protease family) n=1 Tax=Luteimonas terrae TaxID=1530191 RepID=A0ABU1Y0K8_9GAMM|nr:CPBP family glutamic-type intramembrane protease [Luteimonas terrae]MDR7194557.1 membrane protease YdiL (CAAX protease family) [Luteimonas terrae]